MLAVKLKIAKQRRIEAAVPTPLLSAVSPDPTIVVTAPTIIDFLCKLNDLALHETCTWSYLRKKFFECDN